MERLSLKENIDVRYEGGFTSNVVDRLYHNLYGIVVGNRWKSFFSEMSPVAARFSKTRISNESYQRRNKRAVVSDSCVVATRKIPYGIGLIHYLFMFGCDNIMDNLGSETMPLPCLPVFAPATLSGCGICVT